MTRLLVRNNAISPVPESLIQKCLLPLMLVLAATSSAHAAASLNPSTSRLEFGNGLVGQPGMTRALSLTNSGDAVLLIHSVSMTGTNPGDFRITSDSGESSLSPGVTRSLSVLFKAGATGARSALLAVSHSAAGSPHLVSLAGNGVTTFVNRSPGSVDFGNSPIDVASEQTVTIRNDGNTTLNISSLSLSGFNTTSFYWKPGASYSPSLAPGVSTSIIVGFKPTAPYVAPRDTRTARLWIWDDAPFSPHWMSLAGTATPALVPEIRFSENPVRFLRRLYGGTGTLGGFSIQNSGGAPLTISSIRLSGMNVGDFKITWDSGEPTLTPGASRGFQLQFKPGALGRRSALLEVFSNAAGSPHRVSLEGEGVSTYVRRNPQSIDFGSVPVGQTVERVVTIRNDNPGAELIVDSSQTVSAGTNAGDFYWKPTSSFTTWMSRGGLPYDFTMDIIVGFRPQAQGIRRGSLKIIDNQLYSPHFVTFAGTGQ